MERCDDASSSPAMVNNTDKSLLCHHHHHGRRRSSHSDDDVIAWGQRVTRSIDGKDVASSAPAQRVDLATCTLCSGSDHSQSGPIRCCSDGQEVEHLSAAACWCGGRANNHHLDQPTCSAPPSQHMNPVTSPLDEDEGEVNFDLEQVSSEDDAFTEPPPGQLRHPTTSPAPAPRYRNTYECVRRQSAPGQLVQVNAGPESELQSRRPDIAEYFSSRKQRSVSSSVPGWKLFGKVPPKQSPSKQARIIQQEFEARQVAARCSPTHHAAGQPSRRKVEFEPRSTTALILEDRPMNLPAKSAEETQRHRQQYEQMVAGARRTELKEAQRRHQQREERLKQEEVIANATLVWNQHILSNWDAMKSSRRARDLWWGGLPPSVRGRVWSLAVGNELNITADLYEIFLSRAKEKWTSPTRTDDGASSTLDLITRDLCRTLPSLGVFQKGGPYHDLLQSILGAYTCYRPDVGYVQGMSSMAAMLMLNMDQVQVFISFSNLINRPCQLAFFRVDHQLMLRYFGAFQVFFEETLPRLFLHFQSSDVTPDLYLMDWILSLYMKPLPLDVACRVWDVFFRDGEEFLFRTALGLLRLYEDVLLHLDLIGIAQFLSRLPSEELLSDRLFACISATPMLSGNRKWAQVLSERSS